MRAHYESKCDAFMKIEIFFVPSVARVVWKDFTFSLGPIWGEFYAREGYAHKDVVDQFHKVVIDK